MEKKKDKYRNRWINQEVRIAEIIKAIQAKKDWTLYLGQFELGGVKYEPLPYLDEISGYGSANSKNHEDLRGITLFKVDLSGSYMNGVLFDYSDLSHVNFSNCIGPRSFSNSNILGCNFSNSHLYYAIFNNSMISSCDFSNAGLYGADFENSNVRYQNFTNSNIEKANFKEVKFLRPVFKNTILNEDTDFGIISGWNIFEPKNAAIRTENLINEKKDDDYTMYDKFKDKEDEYLHVSKIYRDLKLAAKAQGLNSLAGNFHFREHKAICKSYRHSKGKRVTYLWKLCSDLLIGFGEKPFRTILVALFSIILFALIYLFMGFEYSNNQESSIINRDFSISLNEFIPTIKDFFSSLYMSVVTFTTLGYGDSHPLGITRLFAAVEALTGTILISLFIATFTRVTIRD